MTEITCVGQALVDCITRGIEDSFAKKKVYRAGSISLSIGGDAMNEATVLSRLGHNVRLVCGVGDDPAGSLILDRVKELGIDDRYVDRSVERKTPIANLLIHEDGTRTSYNGHASLLEEYRPSDEVTKGTRILSLASLFRAPLDDRDTIIRLVRAAKEHGAIVCADTKIPTFRQINLNDISEILPLIDYFFPNDAEAAFFSGQKDPWGMAEFFCRAGIKHVMIKAGREGCYVMGNGERFHMKALPVKAIDGTGAGDNFVAGFLSGLLRGFSLYDCCRYGTVCAAACVQNPGADGGVKSREEADKLL